MKEIKGEGPPKYNEDHLKILLANSDTIRYSVLLQFNNHMTLFKETHWLKTCQKRTIYFQVSTGRVDMSTVSSLYSTLSRVEQKWRSKVYFIQSFAVEY